MLVIACLLALSSTAATARAGWPRPHRLAVISRHVFGTRWRTAACIAHYESTDGAHLFNGSNLGPWQVNAYWHPWASPFRLLWDWPYSARVAYRISRHGTDWSAWSTHARCGV